MTRRQQAGLESALCSIILIHHKHIGGPGQKCVERSFSNAGDGGSIFGFMVVNVAHAFFEIHLGFTGL